MTKLADSIKDTKLCNDLIKNMYYHWNTLANPSYAIQMKFSRHPLRPFIIITFLHPKFNTILAHHIPAHYQIDRSNGWAYLFVTRWCHLIREDINEEDDNVYKQIVYYLYGVVEESSLDHFLPKSNWNKK